ncbi:TPA: P63C domain-containing protein [Neisseria weaveri]
MSEEVKGRAIGGKARAANMTAEERKAAAMKMVEARKAKAALPKAAYKGTVYIGEIEIPCAVLEDGRRIISESGIHNNLGTTGGKVRKIRSEMEKESGAPIPLFLASKTLEPFICKVFDDGHLSPIEYLNGGKANTGYDASILPKVCDVWLMARDAGVLQPSQLPKAQKAEVLMRALAHVGIIALVDEATGYQEKREKDALAKIFEAFVAKELQPWVKTFPIEYYKELCRLYGVKFPPLKNNQFPQFFGHVTNNAVYARLAPEILPELKKAASKQEKKAKLHQFLTNDIGHPKLREHLASVVTMLKLSKDKEDFKRMLDIAHPKFNETAPFDF